MRSLGVLLMLAGTAGAQPAAGPYEEIPVEPDPPGPVYGLGGGFGGGPTWQGGGKGHANRLELELFARYQRNGEIGAVIGLIPALEYWRADEGGDRGFALPAVAVVGLRAPMLRVLVGGGADVFAIDKYADEVGVSVFAPLALARVEIDFRGLRLGVDGRVVRRMPIGESNFTQTQVAITFGYTFAARRDGSAW